MLRILTDVCRAIWAKIANDCLERIDDESCTNPKPNAVIARAVQSTDERRRSKDMDIRGLEPDLAEAQQRCETLLAARPGLPPLVSIRNQLIYLQQVCAGTAGPERLPEIILGLLAVREIEGWDDELACLLHRISAAVDRLKAAD